MQINFFLVFKTYRLYFIIFLKEFFFKLLVSKDVEFNEKLHDILKINIYSVPFLYLIKNLKKPCLGTVKIIFVIFFDRKLFMSKFGTKSLLLKRRIDWYIKLSCLFN